jgi:hypothetical protein
MIGKKTKRKTEVSNYLCKLVNKTKKKKKRGELSFINIIQYN